jgi:hypothetical protein
VNELTPDQYKVFLDDLGILEERTPPREWVQKNSKVLFVFAGIGCLSSVYLEKQVAMAQHRLVQQIHAALGLK